MNPTKSRKNLLTVIIKYFTLNRKLPFEIFIVVLFCFSNTITTAQELNSTIALINSNWTTKSIHSSTALFKENNITLKLVKTELDSTKAEKSIWKFSENYLTVSNTTTKEKLTIFKCFYTFDTTKKTIKLDFDHFFIEYTIQSLSNTQELAILKKIDTRTQYFPKKEDRPIKIPQKKNVWVFILCGQSNMAGRAKVEPMDTIVNKRILTINQHGDVIYAKEPIHFYEPKHSGLDCGLSFAHELLEQIPKKKSILIIPAAIGGSSINQWANDSIVKDVPLLTNFKEMAALGMKHGTIKAILWHQGENDARKKELIEIYDIELKRLVTLFRQIVHNPKIPILIGGLGSYSEKEALWKNLNEKIQCYIKTDSNSFYIPSDGLLDMGDRIHFNSASTRELGKRFAKTYLKANEK
jgi:hypothetical protein